MRLLLFFCLIQFHAMCQEDTVQVIEFGGPEPEFVGGPDSLRAFIARNCIYPPQAIEEEIEGKVLVSFIVEGDGSINTIEVVRSVHPLLDAEAVRLISIMPNWEPMIHKGKPVSMRAGLPIMFLLPKEE